jgi:hypothetical protein
LCINTKGANLSESSSDRVTRSHDGLAASAELARQGSDCLTLPKAYTDAELLAFRERWLAAQSLSFGLSAGESCLRPFHDQVPLEFRDGGDNAHGHLPRWTAEIYSAERKAMDTNPHIGELLNRRAHVHGVPAQPVELSHYEHVASLKAIHELDEARALAAWNAATNTLADDAMGLYCEASSAYLQHLVGRGLIGGADAGVQKGAHSVSPGVFRKDARILPHVQNVSRVIFGHLLTAWPKSSGFVRAIFCGV